MSRTIIAGLLVAGLLMAHSVVVQGGELSRNFRIESQYMGYALQYRVYTPDRVEEGQKYPVLLVTDGELYSGPLGMIGVLDDLILTRRIRPTFVVFVDSRNPDNLDENRRNEQFMCNADYARFHIGELLPRLYAEYPISEHRDDTNILGLSFGGLNSACFGVVLSRRISGIGMHSPASAQHVAEVIKLYRSSEQEPLRVFLSTGTVNDNLKSTRRLRKVLEKKDFDVTYVEIEGATHDFDNWSAVIDDALLALVPAAPD